MKPILGLLALAGIVAKGDESRAYSLDGLIGRPPFGVIAVPVAKAKTPKESYELRGFFGRGASLMVSVRETASGESRWLRLGDFRSKWRLVFADVPAGEASVDIDGKVWKLKLARADGQPLAGAVTPVSPPGALPLYRGAGRRPGLPASGPDMAPSEPAPAPAGAAPGPVFVASPDPVAVPTTDPKMTPGPAEKALP